jgi:phosphomannomutase
VSAASTPIRFGTDGWRGVIADDFTEANVARVVQAVAEAWASTEDPARPVVVGHDTRFNSRRVADLAADILAANGRRVLLTTGPVPTPVVSLAVTRHQAAGGLVVTASHNPAPFNGIKVKAAFGGSATPEFTALVESRLDAGPPRRAGAADRTRIEPTDLLPGYLAEVGQRVGRDLRPRRPLRIVSDAMHGAAADLLGRLVPPAWGEVTAFRERPDPLFGGVHPEPIPPHLDALAERVRATSADLGLATDGDGDRLGLVAGSGRYVTPHEVMALLVRHLADGRGQRGEVAKGFAMGVQVDRVCARRGLPLHVTPIGFKHIASLMRERDILLGGEESGGMGFRAHLPERDGLLSALLVLEAVVTAGSTVDELLASLESEVGAAAYRRRDYPFRPAAGRVLVERLDAEPPSRLGAGRVTRVETLDGRKYWLDLGGTAEAWVLVRPSGTEPVLRVYVEGPAPAAVDALHDAARDLVQRLTGA